MDRIQLEGDKILPGGPSCKRKRGVLMEIYFQGSAAVATGGDIAGRSGALLVLRGGT